MLRPGSPALLVFIGGLVSMGAFSTDMFIPAMPAIRGHFATDVATAQLTFGVFWYGFATGQFFVGPLADRFGRRPVLAAGMALLAVSSVACALAPSIGSLIAWRFIQATGVASAWVLSRAVIRDLHTPEETTRVMGYTFAIMSVLSMAMPISGGYLTEVAGWPWVFALPGFLGVAYVLAVLRWLPESAPERRLSLRIGAVVGNMRTLLRNRTFSGYLLCQCFTLSVAFTFLANGSFFFVEVLSVTPTLFGVVFFAMEGALFISSLATAPLIRRMGRRRLMAVGVCLPVVGCTSLAVLIALGSVPWPWYLLPLAVASLGVGFVMPLAQSGGLGPNPHMAGTASSLLGVGQSLAAATFGTLAATLFDGTAWPMVTVMTATAVVGAAIYGFVLRPVMTDPVRP
ncbi:MAG: multidrug effflux MFS transporter [Alphaproteobacteria bacterium]|nr:multidrug effflux MFS transporter [Alphaproteobacteria bacterium]